MESGMTEKIELEVSDQAHLPSLRDWFREQPGLEVSLTGRVPSAGELGALDTITILAGSGGLIAAIKTLPDFIRSRRAGFHIEATVRGQSFVMDATNVEEILPILQQLLDE
jgi:membrane-associated two-gene conflict system component 1 (EACC1)